MSKKNEAKKKENEKSSGPLSWFREQFTKAKDAITDAPGKAVKGMLGIDDWGQGAGMLVALMTVMGLGRSLLGDNIVSTITSTLLGGIVAFAFKDQIKSLTDGISSFFNDSSGSTATKEPAPPALQQRQNVPALPVPAP